MLGLWWEPVTASLALVTLAEIGDKSQLVCMVLAARHGRTFPVLFGAALAFSLLNAVAALLGKALGTWLPETWGLAAMAVLFAAFGIHALLNGGAEDGEIDEQKRGHGLFVTAFLMIFLAEMGDKTQFAVAGLAGIYPALAVWLGATVALVLTAALGVLAGRTVLHRLPVAWLHRMAGALFLAIAGVAAWRLWGALQA